MLFSISANVFVHAQIIGSFAATRTFQLFNWTQMSGSPVKGSATEENFSRRSTPNSNANQPFANCIIDYFENENRSQTRFFFSTVSSGGGSSSLNLANDD